MAVSESTFPISATKIKVMGLVYQSKNKEAGTSVEQLFDPNSQSPFDKVPNLGQRRTYQVDSWTTNDPDSGTREVFIENGDCTCPAVSVRL